ncbi:MAG: T9SS type A sorting domain-containing protein [Calditrichia bacterium]
MLRISIGVVLVTACLVTLTSAEEKALAPNFRVFPSPITQSETFIARHPGNPNILFISCNTVDLSTGFISEGVYSTTDGGVTWAGSDTCQGNPITFHKGDPGIAIDKDGTFLIIRLGSFPGLFSHFSTDNGQTWSGQNTIATNDQDRATLTSDGIISSSHYGRSYAAWVRFAPPFAVFHASTDDGGANWTSPAQVNNPSQRSQGGELSTGPNGEVYVTWAGVINTSPFTEDILGFARSTDGGTSWIVTENAADMNGIAGIFSDKGNIRVNGLPRIDVDKTNGVHSGNIYIVTTQTTLSPAGNDPDIIMYRSIDGGATFSSGIRVNQDALNNGKTQYFPTVHVSDDGVVNVLYYDDRNTATDSTGVFMSRSNDGGVSWTDWQVSDHNFKPSPIGQLGQGYQGDNIGLSSTADHLIPVWMDNSTGRYQLWSSRIPFSEVGISDEPSPLSNDFQLSQNFPNPFNPSTTIPIAVKKRGYAKLAVYDLQGRQIALLLNDFVNVGEQNIKWNGIDSSESPMASGVYFYKLEVDGVVVSVRKMMLLR